MVPSLTRPTFVLFRNLSTAPKYLLSNKRFRTVVLLGLALAWRTLYPNLLLLFRGISSPVPPTLLPPEMPPASSYKALISLFHVGRSLKRLCLVCLPLLHHHRHMSESAHPNLSPRKAAVMAWPFDI